MGDGRRKKVEKEGRFEPSILEQNGLKIQVCGVFPSLECGIDIQKEGKIASIPERY